jgi:hypothetical protein
VELWQASSLVRWLLNRNSSLEHDLGRRARKLTGASTSPYFSLVYLIKRWPEVPMRREILMLSDGIDRFGGNEPSNSDETGGESYYLGFRSRLLLIWMI